MTNAAAGKPRTFERKVDLPAVLGQFLANAKLEDLIIELVQNEIDAGATRTCITFHEDGLVCEGDGAPVDETGWGRLEMVLGAGGEVPAKEDGIGAKNHGLRTGFWLGDEITVQSAGERSDLVLCRDARRRVLDPGAWSRETDPDAPQGRGVRITIPFRKRALIVPSGEGFELPPPRPEILRGMFDEAVRDAPRRLISTVLSGRRYGLELRWGQTERRFFRFECAPARVKGWPGLLRRGCWEELEGGDRRLLAREAVAEFPITLARNDRGKVPRPFRRAGGIVGELSWSIQEDGAATPSEGKLRYPIEYPDGAADAYSGHGFHISAPFISDTARHGLATSAERNARLIGQARRAMAVLMKTQLVPRQGPRVLALARRPKRPDPAAEEIFAQDLLAANALMIRSKSGRGLGKLRFALGTEKLVAACYADAPWEIAPALFQHAQQVQLLAPGTPPFLVQTMVGLPKSRVSLWTDLDAIHSLQAEPNDPRWAPGAALATASEIRSVLERLKLVQRALDRESLSEALRGRLKSGALLPAADRCWTPWGDLYFSRDAVPHVAGLGTPPTVHSRLTELRLLREGPLRLQRFRMDDHLAKADLSSLPSESKEAFFGWLARQHSQLSASTLSQLAEQSIWPAAEGGFAALDAFVAPTSPRLQRILKGVAPYPREDLLSFPGLRRTQRGALYVRPWPEERELQQWFQARSAAIAALEEAGDLPAAVAATSDLEVDLNFLLGEPRIAETTVRIALSHRTANQKGILRPTAQLHLPTPAVQACELLPEDLVAGEHHGLYADLGAHARPAAGAVLAALQGAPREGETLFRRLQAFASEADAKALSELRIIPFAGAILRPCDLSLSHPQNADLWGDWKKVWTPAHLTPDRSSLLVECGVAKFLTEALSAGFFQWLATQSLARQVQHLPQVVRHLRDRQRGPFKWWESRPHLNCLPVRGAGVVVEFISRNRALNPRSQVYLPDFPEAHEQVLEADRSKRLAITDVEGVSGTLFAPLREAGVRSLRRAFGRPLSLTASGEAMPGGTNLEATLQLLRSERMLAELPKRLELHGVAHDRLRGVWRNYLRSLTGVRIAKGLRATFQFGARTYEVPFGAGVDPRSGLVWLDGSRAPNVQLYEAIGVHLFTEEADPLAAYALMRAVEMPFESAAQAPEGARDSLREEEAESPPPPEEPLRLERGHGIAPAELAPAVPKPTPFAPLPQSRPSMPARASRGSRPRAPASTDHLRGSLEELEQIRQMKEDHYGWHCQACLGDYEVTEVAPPGTYVSLPKYRRGIIHAHHVEHLQNGGATGAANLLALCHFHHDLLGDQLAPTVLQEALKCAEEAKRTYPRADGADFLVSGRIATVKLDKPPHVARLFFTCEHAAIWLGE